MEDVDFSKYFYYDETSYSCLKRKDAVWAGKGHWMLVHEADSDCGFVDTDGYYRVSFQYKALMTHRIIWELLNGPIPKGHFIDHEDGNRSNNKIENLRCGGYEINNRNVKKQCNNTSGVTGVTLLARDSKNPYWCTQWYENGVRKRKLFSVNKLGYEQAFEAACLERSSQINELNKDGAGFSERHGK